MLIFIDYYDSLTFFLWANSFIQFAGLIKCFNFFVLFSKFKINFILIKSRFCIQKFFTILIGARNYLKSVNLVNYIIFCTFRAKTMNAFEYFLFCHIFVNISLTNWAFILNFRMNDIIQDFLIVLLTLIKKILIFSLKIDNWRLNNWIICYVQTFFIEFCFDFGILLLFLFLYCKFLNDSFVF